MCNQWNLKMASNSLSLKSSSFCIFKWCVVDTRDIKKWRLNKPGWFDLLYSNHSKPGLTLQFVMILHCFTQNFGWESRIKCLFDFIAHIYQTKNDLFVTKKCAKGAHYKLFLTEIIWVGHVRHVVRCKHYATYYTWDTQTLVTLIKSRIRLPRSVAN